MVYEGLITTTDFHIFHWNTAVLDCLHRVVHGNAFPMCWVHVDLEVLCIDLIMALQICETGSVCHGCSGIAVHGDRCQRCTKRPGAALQARSTPRVFTDPRLSGK